MNQYLVFIERNVPATAEITPAIIISYQTCGQVSKFLTFSNGSNSLGGLDTLTAVGATRLSTKTDQR